MANLDSWAPQLGIRFFRSPNGKYRAVATWRGGDGYNVSFAPQGIKDFVTGEGFSPSGLVERALGIDSWDSDNWLREKLGLQPLRKSFSRSASRGTDRRRWALAHRTCWTKMSARLSSLSMAGCKTVRLAYCSARMAPASPSCCWTWR
jgi:hypothetical protein